MAKKKTSKECTLRNARQISGVHYTKDHTGKMEGMPSLSTSTLCNARCRQNAKIKGSICEHCFSESMLNCKKNMQPCLERNTEILTSRILEDHEIPMIYATYFRFESFGDLNNSTQCINYFKHCYKNPHVKFALWTKNPDFIAEAIAMGYAKPDNLVIVLSSLFINVVRDHSMHPFVDKVFTVYSKDYLLDHPEIIINCGSKNCFMCHICYEKNDVVHIFEIKK